jgi:hypothetical protein
MLEEFRTSQLQVAAFLVASGAQLFRVEKVGPRAVEFIFQDKDGSTAALAVRFFEHAKCEAFAFMRALTGLRYQIDKCLGTLRDKGVPRG